MSEQTAAAEAGQHRIPLGRLVRVFAWIGLTSLGGGRSAYTYDTLVERRHWLTPEEFLPGLALSQLLPGSNVANLSVFLGQRLRGGLGGMLALLAVLLPGALMVLGLSALYFSKGITPGADALLAGMGAAVAGFLCVNAGRMAKKAFRSRGAPWIAALTFLGVAIFRLNTFLVAVPLGALSLWLNRPKGADAAGSSPETGG